MTTETTVQEPSPVSEIQKEGKAAGGDMATKPQTKTSSTPDMKDAAKSKDGKSQEGGKGAEDSQEQQAGGKKPYFPEWPQDHLQFKSVQERLWYNTRQYVGLVINVVAIFCLGYFYEKLDQDNRGWLSWGTLAACSVGLVFHELRPFKRLENIRAVIDAKNDELDRADIAQQKAEYAQQRAQQKTQKAKKTE